MRSTNDNPIDSLGSIGAPIRQPAPAKPDPVRPFEQGDHSNGIGDHSKALESIAETIRKQLPVIVSDGQEADWEGLELTDYQAALLGCI